MPPIRLEKAAANPFIGGGRSSQPRGSARHLKHLMQEAESAHEEWSYEARRIKIHDAEAFAAMRRAGRLAAETLDFVTPHVEPGISTGELDRLCHDFIVAAGAIPAPLNYRGFPKSICTSINHVVCHGIPGDKRL